jgi:hypothetical protein
MVLSGMMVVGSSISISDILTRASSKSIGSSKPNLSRRYLVSVPIFPRRQGIALTPFARLKKAYPIAAAIESVSGC